MRIARVVLVGAVVPALAAVSTPARADVGGSFDFGYVRSRVAVTDDTALDGQLARFGLRISMGRYVHFGAEAEEGTLSGSTALPDGAVARTVDGGSATGPLGGNTLGLKAFAGVHSRIGAFRIGADLATGVRDTWVESDAGMDVAGRKNEGLLELRSRADVILSPAATLGLALGSDLLEARDVSIAAVFAINFTR